MPLEIKVEKTKLRVREWVERFGTDGVYVSFSGGKDSTVLLHIVREMYGNDIPAVFVNTGLEYPEIQSFVKTFENVEILRPKMRFDEVIKKYGYPIIGKKQADTIEQAKKSYAKGDYTLRLKLLGVEASEIGAVDNGKYDKTCNNSKFNCPKYKPLLFTDFNVSALCCDYTKKQPMYDYEKQTGKHPIMATMTEESMMREKNWVNYGCNAFDSKHPKSAPMSFWTEQNVLQYIKLNNFPIASVYGDIVAADDVKNQYDSPLFADGLKLKTTDCQRTGCIFCAFGANRNGDTRFLDLKQTHPKQYAYCIGGGEFVEGVWKPSKDGLGMGYVFDSLNKIYGKDFIKYK